MALFSTINKLGRFPTNLKAIVARSSTTVSALHDHHDHHDHNHDQPKYREIIGDREVVGGGFTGREDYYDLKIYPCPPIRFKKPTAETDALREKEKGNWKSLSLEEKKALYRYSFCQTFAEFNAATPEWKYIMGDVLFLLSVPILMYVLLKTYLVPPLPESMSDEGKKKMVRFYIDNQVDPIDGIASKWDYEKNEWKEKPFWFIRKKND